MIDALTREKVMALAARSTQELNTHQRLEIPLQTRDLLGEENVLELLRHLQALQEDFDAYREFVKDNRRKEIARPLISGRSIHLVIAASYRHYRDYRDEIRDLLSSDFATFCAMNYPWVQAPTIRYLHNRDEMRGLEQKKIAFHLGIGFERSPVFRHQLFHQTCAMGAECFVVPPSYH